MRFLVLTRGSFDLGEMPVSEDKLREMAKFHRQSVEGETPEEAAKQAIRTASMQRAHIDEIRIGVPGEWIVYDRSGTREERAAPGLLDAHVSRVWQHIEGSVRRRS